MSAHRRALQQPRRDPDPARLHAADGQAHLLLHQGDRAGSRGSRLLLQSRLRLLAREGAQAAVYWLREAVRRNTVDGDAHSSSASRCRRRVPRPRARASWACAAAVVEVRRVGEEAGGRRPGAQGARAAQPGHRDHARPAARRRAAHQRAARAAALAAFHLERGAFYESEHDRDARSSCEGDISRPMPPNRTLLAACCWGRARSRMRSTPCASPSGARIRRLDAWRWPKRCSSRRTKRAPGGGHRALALDPGLAEAKCIAGSDR